MTLAPALVAELVAAGLPEHRTGCWEKDCRKPHHARGLCSHHYHQRYRPQRSYKPYVRRGPAVRRPGRPMDWDMVRRALYEPVPGDALTLEEARCAAWLLTQQGRTAAWIADRLHVTPRTVVRWRTGWRNALNEQQPGQQEMHQVRQDEAA